MHAEAERATAPSPPEPGPDPIEDALAAGAPGPFLLHAGTAAARRRVHALAARLAAEPWEVLADTIGLAGDPVGDMTAALRDAVFLRVRTLKKVYEGRIVAVAPVGAPVDDIVARRVPPALLEVELETDEDRRQIRLQGGFVRAFIASGAQAGDIVQIDRDRPIVSVRRDRVEAEGRVAEERDFVYRVRLGDRDRDRHPPIEGADADTAVDVPPRAPLYGTGRLPNAGAAAMQATDRWVGAQLGNKGTRLEPGILLVAGADALAPAALVVLREAIAAPVAPILVLQSEDAAALDRLERAFVAPLRLGGTD